VLFSNSKKVIPNRRVLDFVASGFREFNFFYDNDRTILQVIDYDEMTVTVKYNFDKGARPPPPLSPWWRPG